MSSVYILYSLSSDRYYIGSCKEVAERFEQHLFQYFPKAFTSQADDWVIYFEITNLGYPQARRMEKHIKKMKSRKYIEDLKRYPELAQKLIKLYDWTLPTC